MAYQTLYRKWRPKTFDEVVGQDHITSTLKNEIVNNKIAHAYLFTGTRGTGKTSTAKILSRAINCENPLGGNPCNECSSCRGIINETILAVVEMDAASNTGVDSIREIIDQVRYSTASTKYKVYIIDEVHMLSMGAFNALLKTLEEPPAHVVFILATTEIHKIPATILSRCQRFDFKNIGTMDIAGAVAEILRKEEVTISRDAVEYIAYLGNGSMRDALSITEQCLAYKPTDIEYSDVTEILGTFDEEFLYRASEYIALGDVKSLLMLFGNSMDKGKNPTSFAEGMLKAVRDILIYKLSPEMCDFSSGKKAFVEKASEVFTKEKLVRCVDVLASSIKDIRVSANASVVVEATLIRLASPEYECDVNSLLDRISTLEQKISNAHIVSSQVNLKPVSQKQEPDIQPVKSVPTEPKSADRKDTAAAPADANVSPNAVVSSWNEVIKILENTGKLITFVSLYGVNPRYEDGTVILPFETKEAASKFANSSGVGDVKKVISDLFSIQAEVRCIWEEKKSENIAGNEDIFTQIAQMSENQPENFKID